MSPPPSDAQQRQRSTARTVLILDDELREVERHENRFKNRFRGRYSYLTTQSAEEAIELATRDKSIAFALIDEVLMHAEKQNVHQRYSGRKVVELIAAQRNDIWFVFVTKAPEDAAAEEGYRGGSGLKNELMSISPQVLDVVDKCLFSTRESADITYARIFKRAEDALEGRLPVEPGTGRAVLVVGYGLPSETLRQTVLGTMADHLADRHPDMDGRALHRKRNAIEKRKWIRLGEYRGALVEYTHSGKTQSEAEFEAHVTIAKLLGETHNRGLLERALFRFNPKSKLLEATAIRAVKARTRKDDQGSEVVEDALQEGKPFLRVDSYAQTNTPEIETQPFHVLRTMGEKAECGERPTISEEEYEFGTRKSGPRTRHGVLRREGLTDERTIQLLDKLLDENIIATDSIRSPSPVDWLSDADNIAVIEDKMVELLSSKPHDIPMIQKLFAEEDGKLRDAFPKVSEFIDSQASEGDIVMPTDQRVAGHMKRTPLSGQINDKVKPALTSAGMLPLDPKKPLVYLDNEEGAYVANFEIWVVFYDKEAVQCAASP